MGFLQNDLFRRNCLQCFGSVITTCESHLSLQTYQCVSTHEVTMTFKIHVSKHSQTHSHGLTVFELVRDSSQN